jgi:putative FmdB family regulatory protein
VPIYDFICKSCGQVVEKIQTFDAAAPTCCSQAMARKPTHQAMIFMDGMGGYPSRRKYVTGTAPNTSSSVMNTWDKKNPVPFKS